MKKLLIIVAAMAVATCAFAQDTNTVQLSADQMAKVTQAVNDLAPMLSAKYQGLVNAVIGMLGVFAIIGRIIVGWKTRGLGGVISGLFGGTNTPNPPPATQPKGASLLTKNLLILGALGVLAVGITGCATHQVVNFSKGTGLDARIPIGINGANFLEFDIKVGQFYSATAVQPVNTNAVFVPAVAFASSTDGTVTAPQIGGTNQANVTGGDKFTASIGAGSGSISNIVGNTTSTGK